uniref:hypothetical protein n=1 Tax=Alloprevotella sp. TaxID=1872471 RepID=UPI003FEF36B3
MAKKEKNIEDFPLELEKEDYNMLEQMEDVPFAKLMRAWWEFFRGNEYEKYLSPDNQFQFEYLTFRTNKRRNERYEKVKKQSDDGKKAIMLRWENEKKKKQKKQTEEGAIFADAENVEKYPFEDFYEAFGNKKKPKEARKAWSKLKEEEKALAMEKVSQYVSYIRYRAKKENWATKTEYQMLPSSYLNGKCWEGEYETPSIDNQTASNYGSNNGKSYKEAEFERNARTIVENLQAAERGELAYLSPFNTPDGEH